jgi:hypothetical protein
VIAQLWQQAAEVLHHAVHSLFQGFVLFCPVQARQQLV